MKRVWCILLSLLLLVSLGACSSGGDKREATQETESAEPAEETATESASEEAATESASDPRPMQVKGHSLYAPRWTSATMMTIRWRLL